MVIGTLQKVVVTVLFSTLENIYSTRVVSSASYDRHTTLDMAWNVLSVSENKLSEKNGRYLMRQHVLAQEGSLLLLMLACGRGRSVQGRRQPM